MTAEIFNIRDYQNPKDFERLYGETALEQQAVEIKSVVVVEDTAPSEYVAPKDDPA